MIIGMHAIIYSRDAEADRAFFRDVLGFSSVDAGEGWLIFAAPPTEVACHPAGSNGKHELYLMCDSVRAEIARLSEKGIACGAGPRRRVGPPDHGAPPGRRRSRPLRASPPNGTWRGRSSLRMGFNRRLAPDRVCHGTDAAASAEPMPAGRLRNAHRKSKLSRRFR